ncbi:OPT/YSL family transporter [Actinomadura sp. WMMB 499]|uniref:OPT/YSL family transporter n=1 Tax=Actinomadura sp. WMMB 499 TaxID=1219491 RepID=UPI0012443ECD|nr:OPT/YSL family transporter [Actinomadura sp. WMMB 499]QFG20141.1 OPT family oligopeptide transporter [Actinomadura sp. WMMB 499]
MTIPSLKGAALRGPESHPRAYEPVVLILTIALSVLGALIGLHLVTTLGISANTSVIGALIAMLVGRVPARKLREMRSVHRQNLVQSAISGATFAAANSLLVPIGVPFVLGRPDLVWPMLLGAGIGLFVDSLVLYRVFDSKLFPARSTWPPGVAAAETIVAGDEGGRKAVVLGIGGLVGFLGSFVKIAGNALPVSAAGVALIGNIWALGMFGVGLGVNQYGQEWFDVDLNEMYIPHGFMVGAGLVALIQAVVLLARRQQEKAEDERAEREERDGRTAVGAQTAEAMRPTVDENGLRRALAHGYVLFVFGALVVALTGGILGDLSVIELIGWCLLAGFAALVHQLIVGLAAMHSGWFPAFAVTLIFMVLGLVIGIPTVPLALFVAYISATGPAFADMGYDLKAGWILRQGGTPYRLVERAGRKQQYIAQLVGFAVALAVVAVTWKSYFEGGEIPPVSKVYADTVAGGLTDTSTLTNILIWAVPGALIQFIGGPERQMGVLLATGLLILTPYACWFVLGALAFRIIWARVRGPEAASGELNLIGSGLIAGGSLTDVSRVVKG